MVFSGDNLIKNALTVLGVRGVDGFVPVEEVDAAIPLANLKLEEMALANVYIPGSIEITGMTAAGEGRYALFAENEVDNLPAAFRFEDETRTTFETDPVLSSAPERIRAASLGAADDPSSRRLRIVNDPKRWAARGAPSGPTAWLRPYDPSPERAVYFDLWPAPAEAAVLRLTAQLAGITNVDKGVYYNLERGHASAMIYSIAASFLPTYGVTGEVAARVQENAAAALDALNRRVQRGRSAVPTLPRRWRPLSARRRC